MLQAECKLKETAKRQNRLQELEKEYESANTDLYNEKRIDELHFMLLGLIGKNNRNFLAEYADLVIAKYNIDIDWFYQKGYEDAMKFAFNLTK